MTRHGKLERGGVAGGDHLLIKIIIKEKWFAFIYVYSGNRLFNISGSVFFFA